MTIGRTLKKAQYRNKRPVWAPPSSTPGVSHVVEGSGQGPERNSKLATGAFGEIYRKLYPQAAQKQYGEKQAARARIKPIIDPDADASSRRRKAAKRKTKGRMGTILSQGQGTQNLGAKGTLG